ncbi:hypothetical protein [Alishewanella longhuensis]
MLSIGQLLEAIAGMIDPDKALKQQLFAKLEEEAGLTLTELWPMLSYFSSPGGSTEKISLFLGRLTAPVQSGLFGLDSEHEDIKMHVMPRATAMALLASQQIDNAATVIALQWLALNLPQVQLQWGQDVA